MFLFHSALFVLAGIVIGAIGSTVGGSGLLAVPLLISFGLSPVAAIATGKFAVISSFVTGGFTYSKDGLLRDKRLALALSIPALLGSIIGALVVLRLDQAVLSKIIIFLLIAVLILTVLKKDLGAVSHRIIVTKTRKLLGVLSMFLLGVYTGFFGAGFGMFAVLALIYFLGFSFLESAALMTIINFFALLAAIAVFASHNAINYAVGIPLLVGAAIGGWLGARFAVLKGSVWIRRLFILLAVALIANLIIKG